MERKGEDEGEGAIRKGEQFERYNKTNNERIGSSRCLGLG